MRVRKWMPVLVVSLAIATADAQGFASVSYEQQDPYAVRTTLDRIGRVLVPVTLDGQGPYRFLVDTGSTGTFIGTGVADELGIGPAAGAAGPTMRIHDVMGTVTAPAVHLDRIEVGQYAAENLTLPTLAIRDSSGAVGVLGVEGLQGRELIVDFRRDSIRVETAGRSIPNIYDRLPAHLEKGGLMVVTVEIDGILVPALIDTGAERTVANQALLDAVHAGGNRPFGVGDALLANLFGTHVPGMFYVFATLQLGSFNFANLPIAVVAPQLFESWGHANTPAVVLGMDILGRADGLVLDYGHSAFYIKFALTGEQVSRVIDYSSLILFR